MEIRNCDTATMHSAKPLKWRTDSERTCADCCKTLGHDRPSKALQTDGGFEFAVPPKSALETRAPIRAGSSLSTRLSSPGAMRPNGKGR